MPRPERRTRFGREDARAAQGRFSLPIRVYYQDTDAGGVVYHGAYVDYLERARTEWLRHLGFDVRGIAEQQGILFIVREMRVAYARPALLDDRLTVTASVQHLGLAQFTCAQEVLRGAEVLAEAAVNLACVSVNEFKPTRVPEELRAAFAQHQLLALEKAKA
jgi:acyl-CoA thioester hydrolase